MKTKALFSTLSVLFCYTITSAQPGTNDFTFDLGTGASSTIENATIQSDGKIIITGFFTTYDGTGRNRIARLDSDGALDSTFNPGTGANNFIYSATVQSDNKIIIVGNFTFYNGTARNYVARLNSDGTLDTTFTPGTGANATVVTAALQSDGKIIIAGNFTAYNGTGRNYIARLNSNGTLDTTFTPGAGANDYVITSAIQSDGRIIIGGQFTSYNGTGRGHIARLNSNGSLDTAFDPGTGASYYVWASAVQSDGKIIIGGNFTTYDGTGRNYIARLNSDGTLDTAFSPGTGPNNYTRAVAMQSDGKIIIAGAFTSCNGTSRNCIARLNADGTLDTTFNPGAGASSTVNTAALQNDGKIIIAGIFSSYDGTIRNRIARILGDLTTGLNDMESGDNFTIYPNPFSTQVTLKTDMLFKYADLVIYNSLGQQVKQVNNISGDEYTLDLSEFASGVYFIKVADGNKTMRTQKIIKQ
ncbi:MAG: T9SS type A sorting domain-containing protein [Bacteroidia bacterium]